MHFNGLLLTKAFSVWAKKTTKELCLMTLNIDANLSALKKMVELNQNKKWKKTDRPDAVWKLSSTLETNG